MIILDGQFQVKDKKAQETKLRKIVRKAKVEDIQVLLIKDCVCCALLVGCFPLNAWRFW